MIHKRINIKIISNRLQPPARRRALAWCVFSCDQALAYAVLAALAAALQASVIAKRGQPELQRMGICAMYGAFCSRPARGSPAPSRRGSPPCRSPSSPPSTSSGSTAARPARRGSVQLELEITASTYVAWLLHCSEKSIEIRCFSRDASIAGTMCTERSSAA